MAEITAKMVQELRKKTDAPMMECKKALTETGGDIESAAEWLRKTGAIKAENKGNRITAEGLVENFTQADGKAGVLIEVNSQTDFVARNDDFKTLVQGLSKQAITVDSVEALMAQPYAADNSIKVDEALKLAIARIGENINVRRLANYQVAAGTEGAVDCYIHTGGRVGVLIELGCGSAKVAANDDFKALARNLAMQVAACPNVEYINVGEIPEAIASKEKEIEMGRDDLANKPDNIKEKIVQGRIDKRLKEMTLVDQPYIKDQNISVTELIGQTAKQLGEDIAVRRFTRFILGEGIEKVESNFADEVAAQMGKM
jgi:elongation factor Ts